MNVHHMKKPTQHDILSEAVEDARAFFDRETPALWELCNAIADLAAREAVEELTGLFNQKHPVAETIARAVNTIIQALVVVPYAVVEILETKGGLNGVVGAAINYYGPKLTDISNRLLRASKSG
ncbi:hypothetical protein FHS72_000770 [Loktanella ponticola]|uniref:Uncharacterized protein n=1 Tax=Yoonia ponticola TaxID=1524255 RepID=A0A7W9EX08_9RHOB|nr:hypothetical protein [Yoonia ponticola]MBB5721163.1 hypothetical protein [Yoonia ponticola]